MISSDFRFTDHAGVNVFVYKWSPDSSPKGVIMINHGMAEHAKRYESFAEALTTAGYVVYAEDHRGHGKTMESMEKAGSLNPDGWNGLVKGLKQLKDIMVKENPELPIFVYGHSWGSFLTQDFMQQWGSELNGVILSGSAGKYDTHLLLQLLAKQQVKSKGADKQADLFYKLGVVPLNKEFEPSDSPNAWLSTIKEEVQKYDDDPLCGFKAPNSYYLEFALGGKKIWNSKSEAKIPKNLPIFIISGSRCSVSKFTKNLMPLIKRYKKLGIKDLIYKIYQGARHEIHNDFCRKEVYKGIISWLDSHL